MTDDSTYSMWEAVIGLEIHVQLNTRSKIFSPAVNKFGEEPNTNISAICTGQPGTLPVLNKEAVKKAVLFGLAINSNISEVSSFDRKSYFYPDTPRNFQITQFYHPIIKGGVVTSDVDGKTLKFNIKEAHLEDDAGMLKHFSSFAGVDYNRAGVPLLEIVSEPMIHSPKQAVAYATAVKAILQYLNISDCNMEEGNIRFDGNISVRPKGSKELRNKTEIKNMNSFAFLEIALSSEIKRQIHLYEANPNTPIDELIIPGTYRWDATEKQTVLMRKKEAAEDYRYFPEPDLPPIVITKKYLDTLKKDLPELPHARFNRYVTELSLSEYNSSILINEKKLADYFEEALKTCSNAKALCNWITIEFFGRLKEKKQSIFSIGIPPQFIANLVNMIDKGKITGKIAKSVADDMIQNPKKDPIDIVKNNPNYQPIDDSSEIEPLVDKVLKENEQSIIDYKKGKDKAFGFLVGQVMKLTKGKASPQIVNDLIKKKIKE